MLPRCTVSSVEQLGVAPRPKELQVTELCVQQQWSTQTDSGWIAQGSMAGATPSEHVEEAVVKRPCRQSIVPLPDVLGHQVHTASHGQVPAPDWHGVSHAQQHNPCSAEVSLTVGGTGHASPPAAAGQCPGTGTALPSQVQAQVDNTGTGMATGSLPPAQGQGTASCSGVFENVQAAAQPAPKRRLPSSVLRASQGVPGVSVGGHRGAATGSLTTGRLTTGRSTVALDGAAAAGAGTISSASNCPGPGPGPGFSLCSSGVGGQASEASMPPLVYRGRLCYADSEEQVVWLMGQLLLAKPCVIGFDIEWTPTFVLGEKQRRTALMQLCYSTGRGKAHVQPPAQQRLQQQFGTGDRCARHNDHVVRSGSGAGVADQMANPEARCDGGTNSTLQPILGQHCRQPMETDGQQSSVSCLGHVLQTPLHARGPEGRAGSASGPPEASAGVHGYPQVPDLDLAGGTDCECLLLHVAHTGIPPILARVLESSAIRKAGVCITGDAIKLKSDFGVSLGGVVELSTLGNERQLARVELVTTHEDSRKWSLAGLVETLLRRSLPKPNHVRLGNWDLRPLRPEQLRYAATDAFASLAAYCALAALPERQGLVCSMAMGEKGRRHECVEALLPLSADLTLKTGGTEERNTGTS